MVERHAIWQMPEMFEYAREAIIPTVSPDAVYRNFYPYSWPPKLGSGPQVIPDDKTRPAVFRFLELAESQGSLDRVALEIEAARKKFPEWKAADSLLAMVHCRAGRFDLARALVPAASRRSRKYRRNHRAAVTGLTSTGPWVSSSRSTLLRATWRSPLLRPAPTTPRRRINFGCCAPPPGFRFARSSPLRCRRVTATKRGSRYWAWRPPLGVVSVSE